MTQTRRKRKVVPNEVRIIGDTAEMILPRGHVTLLDASDVPAAMIFYHHWRRDSHGYATCFPHFGKNNKITPTYLHRLILGFPESHIDHKNGDRLDNRRSNLRLATQAQNMANKTSAKLANKKRGVSRHGKKFKAEVFQSGAYHYMGVFVTEEEAARAYDAKAIELFGEFARLNFPVAAATA